MAGESYHPNVHLPGLQKNLQAMLIVHRVTREDDSNRGIGETRLPRLRCRVVTKGSEPQSTTILLKTNQD